MRYKAPVRMLLAMTFCVSTVRGQQTPPPSSSPIPGDLAATMKALEETLRSTGRVTWAQTVLYYPQNKRVTVWDELISVTADPKSCSLGIVRKSMRGGNEITADNRLFLDEIVNIKVVTTEEFLHQYHHERFLEGPDYQENVQPLLYSAVVNSWSTFDFKFQTKEAAEQTAALLRESVEQCSAVSVKPTAVGGPSLTETFAFVADKLSTQGLVASSATLTKGPAKMSFNSDVEVLQVSPSPTTCSMRMKQAKRTVLGQMEVGEAQLSFRHIGKIEVLRYSDDVARNWSSQGYQITAASPTFVLDVTSPGGESKEFYFADETLANRVAKAMVHAAELCGAGSKPEPF